MVILLNLFCHEFNWVTKKYSQSLFLRLLKFHRTHRSGSINCSVRGFGIRRHRYSFSSVLSFPSRSRKNLKNKWISKYCLLSVQCEAWLSNPGACTDLMLPLERQRFVFVLLLLISLKAGGLFFSQCYFCSVHFCPCSTVGSWDSFWLSFWALQFWVPSPHRYAPAPNRCYDSTRCCNFPPMSHRFCVNISIFSLESASFFCFLDDAYIRLSTSELNLFAMVVCPFSPSLVTYNGISAIELVLLFNVSVLFY